MTEKGKWRKLDNTAKLLATVAGEELTNVFRISVSLKEDVSPDILKQALSEVLEKFGSFKVKLRRGFFWNYFEANSGEPLIEKESTYPCKYIDPHSSHKYLLCASYYKNRINLEIFHALTDGMGAIHFMQALTERYLELSLLDDDSASIPELTVKEEPWGEDGYLKHYRKCSNQHYGVDRATELKGEVLPLDSQSVIHGYLDLAALKGLCRSQGVSITKYLTALLLWSLIQIYGEGEILKHKTAVNLPINLRGFFDSETMANFFAVTNISWPAGKRPDSFEEVLQETGRQMDEKIVKEKLEETISYNVSNEKKWYVRVTPLFIKHMITGFIFMQSSRAYTMTLTNVGLIHIRPDLVPFIDSFKVILGVSGRQKMKCGMIAFQDKLCITFSSILNDTRLSDYFFGFLKEHGVEAELESNGVVDTKHNRGTYPAIRYDKNRVKKLMNIFYLVLFTVAIVTGLVNLATYELTQNWWSVIAIGGIAYAAMTLRYSIMRRASLAGILVIQSLGAQAFMVLLDYMTGFRGWSFNFAIPSVILFDVIAIVFLILVNRLNWQSYFMYQIAITIFSFIPLILWMVGLITRPLMSVITVMLSVSIMIITIVMGDRSVKNELKRRFYL
ncbi:MAG: DUF6320 domain-containing protein [Clostridium sp.]